MPGGRPTIYTDELATTIFSRLADGESLRSICRDKDMPDRSTVFKWVFENEEFSRQYDKAREIQGEALADDLVDIADDGSNDWMLKNDPENPGYAVNGEAIQRSRLRVDARKWAASKLRPKKYGDKLALGGDPEGVPITVATDRDTAKAIASLLRKGALPVGDQE